MAFLETRGVLARLLATENLIVEHDPSANTASFDTLNRVLKLPVLRSDNEYVYNMFVGHEVGHALNTPEDWQSEIPDGVPFDFVNVIEDVRIERLIQDRFPGLRSDFTKAYNHLNDKDFFEICDKDLSKFSLIDRINLHFKLGSRAFVPFSEQETVYVTAVDEANTWQKVLLVAKMIQDYLQSLAQDEVPNDVDGESNGDGDTESQSSQSNSSDSDDESGDGDDDASVGEESDVDETTSETQKSFDDNMEKLSDNFFSKTYDYITPTDVNFDDIISVKQLRDSMVMPDPSFDIGPLHKDDFNKFLSSIKRDVNFMVQQFEMKKSADAYARQQVNKTGVLNTQMLHNYKLTDDIFLRQTVTPDGKSHGLVMLLDWSGSMEGIAVSTVKQIITLVQFCRKVQISFDVYTFTTGYKRHEREYKSGQAFNDTVGFVQVLNSKSRPREIDQDMLNLYYNSLALGGYRCQNVPYSPHLTMGGTPLNNALMMTPQIIERFKSLTNTQKVSLVVVTDGETSPIQYTKVNDYDRQIETYQYYETVMIRSGSKVYPIEAGSGARDVINWVKTQVDDISITHLYLAGTAACRSYLREHDVVMDDSQFRKTGSCMSTSDTWPVLGCINPKTFGDSDEEIGVESGATKGQIRNALKKYLKSKSTNKVFLSQLVGQFT